MEKVAVEFLFENFDSRPARHLLGLGTDPLNKESGFSPRPEKARACEWSVAHDGSSVIGEH